MSVHFHPFKFSVFSSIKQLLFTTLFDGRFVGLVALKNLIDWAVEDLPGFLLVFWCELFLNFAFPGLAQTLKPLFTMPVQSFCRLRHLLALRLHVSLSPTCQNFKTVFFFSPWFFKNYLMYPKLCFQQVKLFPDLLSESLFGILLSDPALIIVIMLWSYIMFGFRVPSFLPLLSTGIFCREHSWGRQQGGKEYSNEHLVAR